MWCLDAVVGDPTKPHLAIKQLGHHGSCGECSQVQSSCRRVLVLLFWVLVLGFDVFNRAIGKFVFCLQWCWSDIPVLGPDHGSNHSTFCGGQHK